MTNNPVSITVLAHLADPSWLGEIRPTDLNSEPALFTNIFRGAVEYRHRGQWRLIAVPAFGLPVVGHLLALSRLLAAGDDGTLYTDQNEFSMVVRHDGESIVLEPNWDEPPLTVAASELRLATATAIATTVSFLRATSSSGLPEAIDHLEQLGQSLRNR